MLHTLEWEDGYRCGIRRCMRHLVKRNPDYEEIWEDLVQQLERSSTRTDRILQDMEGSQ